MNKPHLEFTRVDMSTGWATPPGYPAGIQQKILASDLDESGKTGSRSRLLRFEPGVYTTAPFVHDHWEEAYLISGDLIVGNDSYGAGGESFGAPTYAAARPEFITARSNRWAAACCSRSTIMMRANPNPFPLCCLPVYECSTHTKFDVQPFPWTPVK